MLLRVLRTQTKDKIYVLIGSNVFIGENLSVATLTNEYCSGIRQILWKIAVIVSFITTGIRKCRKPFNSIAYVSTLIFRLMTLMENIFFHNSSVYSAIACLIG